MCYERCVPVPDFIVELRRAIGTAPLWLAGVTAVTIRDGQVLLVKRSDNGAWTAVTGIVEPGENPADCAAREVREETGVSARATRLAWVHVTQPTVHANGDRAQYLDHVFRMQWLAGEPYAADDECTAAAWFELDDLPPMTANMRRRITLSAIDHAATVFDTVDDAPADWL
ncbi:ADP-ribose pyrophosphatase [Mycobacterium sp. E3247]|nr:ADP-ribose pyrophosphatase [Mycobacterium sp. E3247]